MCFLILNGVNSFGSDTGKTYISLTGSSTIDCFILSDDLHTVNVLDSLSVDSSCVESDHLSMSLTINAAGAVPHGREPALMQRKWAEKLIWDSGKKNTLLATLQSNALQDQSQQARNKV